MKIKFAIVFLVLLHLAKPSASLAMDNMNAQEPQRSIFTTVSVNFNSQPVSNATVIVDGQSRITNESGSATFDHTSTTATTATILYKGQRYEQSIKPNTAVTVNLTDASQFFSPKNIVTAIFLLVIIFTIFYFTLVKKNPKRNKFKNKGALSVYTNSIKFFKTSSLIKALLFCFLLTVAAYFLQSNSPFLTKIKTIPKSNAAELPALPQPQNVRAFGDDEVATIVWDKPVTADSNKIVGYVVRWGDASTGTYTDIKQTIHNVVQIQPLVNGKKYTVQVQSVQGSYDMQPTGSVYGGNNTFAKANGNLSSPVLTTVTPSSARKDAMKSRLTAFFDDFESPAGAFDETKWNFGSTNCVGTNENGQFINSQFHAHNQVQSGYCDRAGNVSRPRAIFDTAGRTEANPGIIEFDLDGVSQPRDIWYLDIIPADARKSGIPLDVTSHPTAFEDDHEDPGKMIRLGQTGEKIKLSYYDDSNTPHTIPFTKILCPTWDNLPGFDYCSIIGKQVQNFSPNAEPNADLAIVPNVRRHWVVQYSPQKIKVYIDGAPMFEANTPSTFANITKYQIHSTLFSYNTGKDYNGIIRPTSSMIHWDNFGFNGPASSLVTHNYIDGGASGSTPLLGRGTGTVSEIGVGVSGNLVPTGNKTTKIPIPDQIGSPIGKARLMFTMEPMGGWYEYSWSSAHSINVNGKNYPFPDPRQNINSQNITAISQPFIPHATGIYVDPTDLKQGLNDVTFNLGGNDIFNIHVELDYEKNSAPLYTQPKDIFSNFTSYIVPTMRSSDMYWFVEQDMGVKSFLGSTTPIPPGSTTGNNQTSSPSPTSMTTNSPLPSGQTNGKVTPQPVNSSTPTPKSTVTPSSMSTPSPVISASATPTQTPTVSPIMRLTSGNTYIDTKGLTWSPLINPVGTVSSFTATGQMANTSDAALYLSEKYGKTFGYSIALPNNTYTVKLKFAEVYWSNPGQRVFNVAINGTRVLTNFDILAETSRFSAIDKVYNVTITNGKINLDFTTTTDNAKISAIEIIPTVQTPSPATQATGDGLKAVYGTASGATITVIDKVINFNWGTSAPFVTMPADNFGVKWEGFIVPKYTEQYTFGARTDDGVRVYINNQLIINNWKDRAAAETSGKINLTAGQKYPLKFEYYEKGGSAVAQFFWSSASQSREIVPQSQLYTN